jgi:hypothetical protein
MVPTQGGGKESSAGAPYLAPQADSKYQQGLGSGWPEQAEGRRPEGRQGAGTIAPVAVGILMELGVTNPVPALNASAISHQLQQGFWRGPHGGEEVMRMGTHGLAAPGAAGFGVERLERTCGRSWHSPICVHLRAAACGSGDEVNQGQRVRPWLARRQLWKQRLVASSTSGP